MEFRQAVVLPTSTQAGMMWSTGSLDLSATVSTFARPIMCKIRTARTAFAALFVGATPSMRISQ